MAARADNFDLGALRLSAGEGRRLELQVEIDPFLLSGERYHVEPARIVVHLDISRTGGDGYVLRLRFGAAVAGPCMRCLQAAQISSAVDTREVSQPQQIDERQPREIDELNSPYVRRGILDLRAWARDALALALPAALLCRSECAGLCAACGADLNAAGSEHAHDDEGQGPWAKLSEIRFE
ncbi:MAG: YceD family protein [Solirubrobacteraceae bacterium]